MISLSPRFCLPFCHSPTRFTRALTHSWNRILEFCGDFTWFNIYSLLGGWYKGRGYSRQGSKHQYKHAVPSYVLQDNHCPPNSRKNIFVANGVLSSDLLFPEMICWHHRGNCMQSGGWIIVVACSANPIREPCDVEILCNGQSCPHIVGCSAS